MDAFIGIGFVIVYLLIIVVSFLLSVGLPAILLYFVIKNGKDTKQRLQELEQKIESLSKQLDHHSASDSQAQPPPLPEAQPSNEEKTDS